MGIHNDQECEEYCEEYIDWFGKWFDEDYKNIIDQKLPFCQFKGNKSKIQNLIRKVQIDKNGRVTEVQMSNKLAEFVERVILSLVFLYIFLHFFDRFILNRYFF